MTSQTDLRRLLVLKGPAIDGGGIVDFLRDHFEVHTVAELGDALDAMRSEPYAAVLAETADFLPLERGVVSQQAAVILNTIGDGVCLVGEGGDMVWANRRLREFSSEVIDRLREVCVQAYEQFAAGRDPDAGRPRRYSLIISKDSYYEVICSPVRDRNGLLRQIVAVVVDASSQRRQQQKLNAIDRAGHELVNLDRDTVMQRNAHERLRWLEERIIRYTHNVLNYKHFAVLVLDSRTNRLNEIITEGLDRDGGDYEVLCSPEGSGICGYVAATGRSYICSEVSSDPRYIRGLVGARSSLTVPLRLDDKVVGVMNIESDEPRAFGEEDRQFAEIFANHIALAMNILNLLTVQRHAAHSQVSGSICAELGGPINDIITKVELLMEDYIGHDDLRKRLQGVVDVACQARQTVQGFADAGRCGVLGAPSKVTDPVLGGKRILVADDEKLIRQTMQDVLVKAGAYVDVVSDGEAACDALARVPYDLVISDIKMPGATGYEVFAAAERSCPGAEVILVTAFGYDPNHSIVKANQEGLAAVLMKPFKVRDLLFRCRAALGHPDAEDDED
jgi:CheY-like chemotaxis protein